MEVAALDSFFPERRLRIIVADDNDVVREMVRAIIEHGLSADCSSARDVDEALTVVSETSVDLALLDYNMPGMDGLNGVLRIMATDVRHVALLSGGISSGEVEQAIDMGVSGFLPKVLPPRQLVGAVRAMCLGKKFSGEHFLERLPIAKARTGRERVRLRA